MYKIPKPRQKGSEVFTRPLAIEFNYISQIPAHKALVSRAKRNGREDYANITRVFFLYTVVHFAGTGTLRHKFVYTLRHRRSPHRILLCLILTYIIPNVVDLLDACAGIIFFISPSEDRVPSTILLLYVCAFIWIIWIVYCFNADTFAKHVKSTHAILYNSSLYR